MTTFLFWNLNKKPLERLVADLAELHEVDVLILAECKIPNEVMKRSLKWRDDLEPTHSESDKIIIYTRFSPDFLQPVFDAPRLTIRRLKLPEREEVLLASVHLPDKLHWKDSSQTLECVELARRILSVEEQVGHRRTVLVGDVNMNPFEDGVVAANGFNAVMTRLQAKRQRRTVQDRKYPYFYNPMWGHFGDGSGGPPGTYYYWSSQHVAYFWHMFDQVLIRPELLSIFKNEELKILSAVGERSLVTKGGLPDRSVGSDHLPILFSLDL